MMDRQTDGQTDVPVEHNTMTHTSRHIVSASISINTASVSANGVVLSSIPSVGLSVGLSVSVYVRKVYCGKTAD